MLTSPDNCQLFVELYLNKYLEKDQTIYDAIISGIEDICPKQILRLLNAEMAAETAFSSPKIGAEDFISRLKGEDFTYPITRQLFE